MKISFVLVFISSIYFVQAQQKFGSIPQFLPLPNTNATVAGNGKVLSTDATGKVILVRDSGYNSIPISSLLGATKSNTIDNGNFSQTWSWNTLGNTAAGLTINTLVNSSTAGVFQVANTGVSGLGVVASLQSNSTAGSGVTILANGMIGINDNTPTNTITDSGSFAGKITAVSAGAAYNALSTDFFISWGITGTPTGTPTGDRINLPAAQAYPGNYKGREYNITNFSTTNHLYVFPNGTETIDGLTSYSIPPQNSIKLISNGNTTGSTWDIVDILAGNTKGSSMHLISFLFNAILANDALISYKPTGSGNGAPGLTQVPMTATFDPVGAFNGGTSTYTAPFTANIKVTMSVDYNNYWTGFTYAPTPSNYTGYVLYGIYDVTAATYLCRRTIIDYASRRNPLGASESSNGQPVTSVNFVQIIQGHQYQFLWNSQCFYSGTLNAAATYNTKLYKYNSAIVANMYATNVCFEIVL